MPTDPNIAFLLIVAGVLLIYAEFIWVGKVVFGVAGAIAALLGMAALWQASHAPLGFALLGMAVVCFASEASFNTFCVAGILGGVLWAFGFWKLGCSLQFIFPVSAFFTAVTIWLLGLAKRARRNKRIL